MRSVISLCSRRNCRSLRALHSAGVQGQAEILTDRVEVLEQGGLVERFRAPGRVLKTRVRLTALGVRVVETLLLPKEG